MIKRAGRILGLGASREKGKGGDRVAGQEAGSALEDVLRLLDQKEDSTPMTSPLMLGSSSVPAILL